MNLLLQRLVLIRHARAAERGPDYPNDSLRPLVTKGKRQADTLGQLLETWQQQFDWLVSSPYTRAMQTAEPLKQVAKQFKILGSLATPHYDMLLQELHVLLGAEQSHAKQPDAKQPDLKQRPTPLSAKPFADVAKPIQLALVGHEPYLSELAAYLLTGDPEGVMLQVKKAAIVELSGELKAGKMMLTQLVPYSSYKHHL